MNLTSKVAFSIVISHEGIVNKVSLFDKDMMFLIVFGLRGFKHERESRIGVRCAADLHETFKTWPDISSVSIGVTVGMSYCGVVGHTLRREYSVISLAVNKAARLMIAYPDVVSCERQIVINSKLDMKHFKMMPRRSMKGLHDDVVAYEFLKVVDVADHNAALDTQHPVVEREEVLKLAKALLYSSVRNHNEYSNSTSISCLLIRGEMEKGKTRVLSEIYAFCVAHNINRMFFSMNVCDLRTPFIVIRMIVAKALNLSINDDLHDIIKEKLSHLDNDEFLCTLNPILNTNFPETLDPQIIYKITSTIFKILCDEIFTEFFVIFIDDGELMDKESFFLLDCIFRCSAVFMFMTIGHQRKMNQQQKKRLQDPRVVHHFLDSLSFESQTLLACYFLGVNKLSSDLESFFHYNSDGNPGWIGTHAEALLESDKLDLKVTSNESTEFERIAAYKGRISIDKDFKFNLRNDSDLMIYDSLTTYEQSVCKCASVLGVEFTRHMLLSIMTTSTERMVAKAMVKLFELRILTCASTNELEVTSTIKQRKRSEIVICKCQLNQVPASCRDLPKYALCSSTKFHRNRFCEVVYDSLTEKQRAEYHRKAMVYLHLETKRCQSCGSSNFSSLLSQSFDFKFHDGILHIEDNSFESMMKYFEAIGLPVKIKARSKGFFKFKQSKALKIRPVILNFMDYDFQNCQCYVALHEMYNDMIRHCHGGHNMLKLIETKIHLASLCITVQNVPRANFLLTRALTALNVSLIHQSLLKTLKEN